MYFLEAKQDLAELMVQNKPIAECICEMGKISGVIAQLWTDLQLNWDFSARVAIVPLVGAQKISYTLLMQRLVTGDDSIVLLEIIETVQKQRERLGQIISPQVEIFSYLLGVSFRIDGIPNPAESPYGNIDFTNAYEASDAIDLGEISQTEKLHRLKEQLNFLLTDLLNQEINPSFFQVFLLADPDSPHEPYPEYLDEVSS